MEMSKGDVVSGTLTTAKKGRGRPRKAEEARKKSRTVMASDVQWQIVAEEARIEGKDVSTFAVEELMKVIRARRERRLGNGL